MDVDIGNTLTITNNCNSTSSLSGCNGLICGHSTTTWSWGKCSPPPKKKKVRQFDAVLIFYVYVLMDGYNCKLSYRYNENVRLHRIQNDTCRIIYCEKEENGSFNAMLTSYMTRIQHMYLTQHIARRLGHHKTCQFVRQNKLPSACLPWCKVIELH